MSNVVSINSAASSANAVDAGETSPMLQLLQEGVHAMKERTSGLDTQAANALFNDMMHEFVAHIAFDLGCFIAIGSDNPNKSADEFGTLLKHAIANQLNAPAAAD